MLTTVLVCKNEWKVRVKCGDICQLRLSDETVEDWIYSAGKVMSAIRPNLNVRLIAKFQELLNEGSIFYSVSSRWQF